ncbi:TetR family transcriptional regulator [Paenibacillus baekrokdamisoli]|uniref:TetR family transcriptional regulator n=1 Tax=Paenibacillus baekrokdamisoli TaxID=1712516 RepID=A0A3G9JEQ3_9BACL|nr:TetR family transcriptional regulator [Paenibacillus baekrokdamisoli]MBB3072831.1 AcrR family transcriptional regulator [Paenibacillus baekrokdamisoli]BBH24391.1 TetR family transcriptional regulator [Paenibacillus baekrokdamisoli]
MTIPDNDSKMRILLAARKLFATKGFDGTTVRQICEEAGVNVALVSYHFGGKENMFPALFDSFFFPNEMIAAMDREMDPLEGLKFIISEVTRFRGKDPELISIIQQEVIMNTPRVHKIREHVVPIWNLLQHWLVEGRKHGVFHYRSLDTALMSTVGTLLFHQDSDYWKVMKVDDQVSIDEMIEDITAFILGGLQVKG